METQVLKIKLKNQWVFGVGGKKSPTRTFHFLSRKPWKPMSKYVQ